MAKDGTDREPIGAERREVGSRCLGCPMRAKAARLLWIGGRGRGGRAGTVFDQPEPEELIELTVIVPARNEEDCLGACLQSLVEPVGGDLRAGQGLGADRGG